MHLFVYFNYKLLTLVVDLDFKAPMPTHLLVQKLSDSRCWFVLGRFRLSRWWNDDTHGPLEGYRCPLQPVSSHWIVLVSTSTLPLETSGYLDFGTVRNSWHIHWYEQLYYSKKFLCNLVIRSVFPLCEAIVLECSQSPIPRCTSLIISIWRSFSLTTSLFL